MKKISGITSGFRCSLQALCSHRRLEVWPLLGTFNSRFMSTIPQKSDQINQTGQTELQLSYILYERGNDVSKKSPILLHHSLMGRKENWEKTGKDLNHLTRRSVIIPDARNHGNSPSCPVMNYKLMSGDVVRLLGGLNVKKVSFVGHAMGGRVGMYTALHSPDLVDRLVVVSTSPLNGPSVMERKDQLREACYVFMTLRNNNNEGMDSLTFKLEADKALKSVLPDQKERALFISNLKLVNHEAILGNPDLGRFPAVHNRAFTKPVLFIYGDQAPIYNSEQELADIKTIFPNSTFVEIAGAGHWVHLESKSKFLEHVAEFLETEHPKK